MFVIRTAQMVVFDRIDLGRFVASCVDVVLSTAAAGAGREAALALVRDTIRLCGDAGIRRKGDVVRVLRLRLAIGEAFDRSLKTPEIDGLLGEKGLSGTTKTDLLCGQLASEVDEDE